MGRFREGVVPPAPPGKTPGYFYFPQEFEGGIEWLSGSNTKTLSDNVLSFRSRQGLDIGNPIQEIDLYLCSVFPHLCNAFDASEPQVADESKGANEGPTRRLTAWRSNRYSESQSGRGSEAARQDIAEARAQICAQCPARQEKPTEGCIPCLQENERVLFILRQGKAVGVNAGLCSITGQDNETASFMTLNGLNYSKKYEEELRAVNPSCWLLPESELR